MFLDLWGFGGALYSSLISEWQVAGERCVSQIQQVPQGFKVNRIRILKPLLFTSEGEDGETATSLKTGSSVVFQLLLICKMCGVDEECEFICVIIRHSSLPPKLSIF